MIDYIVRLLYFAAYSVIRMPTLAEKGVTKEWRRQDWDYVMNSMIFKSSRCTYIERTEAILIETVCTYLILYLI